GDGSVTIFFNDGAGNFSDVLAERLNIQLPDPTLMPQQVIVADLDSQNGLDIAVACANPTSPALDDLYVVLSSDFTGSVFNPPSPVNLGVGSLTFGVAAGEMDGVLGVDLVLTEYQLMAPALTLIPGSGAVRVLSNDGFGVFTVGPAVLVDTSPPGTARPRSVAIGNFDPNSAMNMNLDVVVGNDAGTSQSVVLLLGDPMGNLSLSPAFETISNFSNIHRVVPA
ncbi:MAG: hypothetical protein ACKVJX_25085, partial [Verrucomicrobiia bacterium]